MEKYQKKFIFLEYIILDVTFENAKANILSCPK